MVCVSYICVSVGHVLHMSLEAIGLPWIIFQTGSTTGTWGLQIRLGWLASEARASGCLYPPCSGIVGTHHCIWFFTWVLVTAPSSCLCSRQLNFLHGNASCTSLQCKCCLSPVWNKIRQECFLLLKTFPNCHLYLTTNGRKEKQKTMLCRKWCLLFPRFALWPLALLFLQDCPFS